MKKYYRMKFIKVLDKLTSESDNNLRKFIKALQP